VYLTGQDFDEEGSIGEHGRTRLTLAVSEAVAMASVLSKS
jgi:hypothetical protein